MSAGKDEIESALEEDWKKFMTGLLETDLAAFRLINHYFIYTVKQFRPPRLRELLLSLRAIGMWIATFAIAATLVVLMTILA